MTRFLALLLLIVGVALLRKSWRMDANYADDTWGSAIATAVIGGLFVIASVCMFAVAAIFAL